MELWIRSQNKGALIKVEMLGNTDGTIKSYLGVNQTVLGTYKSNERALEVLDEIQDMIINNGIKNEVYDEISGCYYATKKNIYEMPME